MENDNRLRHEFVIGQSGKASKTFILKESEFKKEFAPTHAEIVKKEINGETYIFTTYEL